jgi:hypothetical protein
MAQLTVRLINFLSGYSALESILLVFQSLELIPRQEKVYIIHAICFCPAIQKFWKTRLVIV